VREIQVVRLKVEEFSSDYELVLPKKIGFTGTARSGKSTVAKAFADRGWWPFAIGDMIKDELGPVIQQKMNISAYTEIDKEKSQIRGILEAWGYANHDRLLPEIVGWMQVRDLCVNTRVFDAPEAEMWQNNGGVIVEVQREGVNSETEVARMALRRVRGNGVDITIQNNTDMRSKDFSPCCWLEQISYGIEALENSGKVQLIWG
jgi:hypothetical protein